MAISLTQIISALEAKSNTTDSSTAISDVLRLTQASEQVSDGKIIYDSAGVLPTGTDWIGSIAATADGTLYFYNGTTWNTTSGERSIPWTYQGLNYGYSSTGADNSNPDGTNRIEKFSLVSLANATDVGDALQSLFYSQGSSSTTHGYIAGGRGPGGYPVTIEKFTFSSDGNTSDVADLTRNHYSGSGQTSEENGYVSGGATSGSTNNVIEKFPFATDANATDVGDLTLSKFGLTGHSMNTHGYSTGGHPLNVNTIEKFSFSTDGNATDVGDLVYGTYSAAGMNTGAAGYSSGGQTNPWTNSNIIQKFPFATDANAVDVADPISYRKDHGGVSSTTHGYTTGGDYSSPGSGSTNQITRFEFATDGNATDARDLVGNRKQMSSQQY